MEDWNNNEEAFPTLGDPATTTTATTNKKAGQGFAALFNEDNAAAAAATKTEVSKPKTEVKTATLEDKKSENNLEENSKEANEEGEDEEQLEPEGVEYDEEKAKVVSGERHRILDTGALIRGIHLQDYGSHFYTVRDVFNEVKDETTRAMLQALPFEIKVREPTEIDLKQVYSFAMKTGDGPRLSKTDLRVMALGLGIERELNGVEHVRKEPSGIQTKISTRIAQQGGKKAIICDQDEQLTPEEIAKHDFDNDGEGDWISSDNLTTFLENKTVAKKHQKEESKSKTRAYDTAVITTDFAMQNVLLQMGLNVQSAEGYFIKRTKRWALRCPQCSHIHLDNEKVFCQSCGNHGLAKISVSIDEDGEMVFYHNPKWRARLRGTVYSIPKPKGGRRNNDLILREDQLRMGGRDVALRKQKKEMMKEGFLDFDEIGLDSRKSNKQQVNLTFGYGRRNPNEARRGGGKKKRRR